MNIPSIPENRDDSNDDMNIPSIPENRDDSNDDMNIPSIPENIEGLTLFVKSDLAQRLGVVINDIDVCSITEVEWNDTSLGCPQEDMNFAQIITPGFTILLEVNGQTYEYHTDKEQRVVLCTDIIKATPPPFR
jgi:hypothetical protein